MDFANGAGRSPFGYGWSLSVPKVTRRATKALPTYTDADAFGVSGSDDLVPELTVGAGPVDSTESIEGRLYRIRRFRPRTDTSRLRIERCTAAAGTDVFWRTVDAGNVTRVFGRSPHARIADPTGQRIFEWLLEEVRDDRGNVARYEYQAEDTAGVVPQPGEAHRLASGAPAQTNRYLKRIRYANTVPDDPDSSRMLVVFDYGDHDLAALATRPWPVRWDPYSVYQAGFEIRTWRLCRRIMMFHDFGTDMGPGPTPRLVRTVELGHDTTLARLTSLRHVGYQWTGTQYAESALPPLEFEYVDARTASDVRVVDLPSLIDGAPLRFADLNGDAMPGVLSETPGGWWYRAPAGDGRFERPVRLTQLPSSDPGGGVAGLRDIDGSVRVASVVESHGLAGSSVRLPTGDWDRFQPYASRAVADLTDPRGRRVDLNGDGLPDPIFLGPDGCSWVAARGRAGYGATMRIPTAADERSGPRPPSADQAHQWFVADMSGDGLADLVRVRACGVDYWPNLGYGRYGSRVTMTSPPMLASASEFDGSRVRLVDLDGTGAADLLYLGDSMVTRWRNLSGTAWSSPTVIAPLPPTDNAADVQILDLLGNATPCLVWTSSRPGQAATVRFLELAADGKAHQMRSVTNNLGGRTVIEYDSSARQALAARRAGAPWRSTVGCPAVVVSRMRVFDDVAQTTQVTRYLYRDAYFDPIERESRGFSYAETISAETTASGTGSALRTCEWFYTGRPGEEPEDVFESDPDAVRLPGRRQLGLTGATEYRQSLRALAGRQVRSETYAVDVGPSAPLTVTQWTLCARQLQPSRGGSAAVFRVEPSESMTAHYDRTFGDPRVTHEFTLATDDYGTPWATATLAYPRRAPEIDEQRPVIADLTLTDHANVDTAAVHRIAETISTREYEITGLTLPPTGRFLTADLTGLLDPGSAERDYLSEPTPGLLERRLVAATRHEYWDDSLAGALPGSAIGSRALVRSVFRFAFTQHVATTVFGAVDDPATLTGVGGYQWQDKLWWLTDGVRHYDPTTFYLPSAHTSPQGNTADVRYDSHALLLVRTRAATAMPLSSNTVEVANDYHTLCPRRLVDPNGVVSRVRCDPLGRVIAGWLTAPDGSGDPEALPGVVHSYDSVAWQQGRGPAWSHSEIRARSGDATAPPHEQRVFVDGLGRLAMTKSTAEPGEAWADDGAGGLVLVDTAPAPRWIGTGRTVFNGQGLPIEQYEPYFAVDASFDMADSLVKRAPLQRRRYDALGRLVRVDHPDGTVETMRFEPWRQVGSDRNDTVLLSDWYAERLPGGAASAEQQRAAALTAAHAGTDTVLLYDGLGRTVRVREDNGPDGIWETRYTLDPHGRTIEVHDARGVRACAVFVDAAGRTLRTESIDAGTQIVLPDGAGRPLAQITAAGDVVSCRYDLLGRPTQLLVRDPGAAADRLAELTVYGETHPNAAELGLVGRVHRRYHEAGLSRMERYDPRGNVIAGSRRLLRLGAGADWTALAAAALADLDAADQTRLDGELFTETADFDSLGRPVRQRLADGTELVFGYHPCGPQAWIDATLAGTPAPTRFLSDVRYDARRRRTSIAHGNGVVSTHEFDSRSGRLVALAARRGAAAIQDLRYTYDPVGNVVQVQDAVADTVFFAGSVVAPGGEFTYDPGYRLRTATGREHRSLAAQPDNAEPAVAPLPHPNDAAALRRYTEYFDYDSVGNITTLRHASASGAWTRRYRYAAGTNRLVAHQLPGDPDGGAYHAVFAYDDAGNTVDGYGMPAMAWDHVGRLATANLSSGGGLVDYFYDGPGNRVRKVWQRPGALREERIYLGNVELFRRYRAGSLVFERRTVRIPDEARIEALVETVTVDADHPGFDAAFRIRYQLGDVLGSVAVECDQVGAVISYEEYHPFGSTALWLARGAAAVSTKRYRYLGKEKDEESGLYHIGVRQYACWLGRWMSPDPAGLIDGVNRYRYVDNNPVSRSDPTGTQGVPTFQEIPWVQTYLTESTGLRFAVKATGSGKFQAKHYDFAKELAALWGGAPQGYQLGHAADTPLWSLKIGEVSLVGIQAPDLNNRQSIQEGIDRANAAAQGWFTRTARKTTVSVPNPMKGQPALDLGVKPLTQPTLGKLGDPTPGELWAAAQANKPPVAPPSTPTPAGETSTQLELPGTQQQSPASAKPPEPATGSSPAATASPSSATDVELIAPKPTDLPASAGAGPAPSQEPTQLTSDAIEGQQPQATPKPAADPVPPSTPAADPVVASSPGPAPADAAQMGNEVSAEAKTVSTVGQDIHATAEITQNTEVLAQDTKLLTKVTDTAVKGMRKAAPVLQKVRPVAQKVATGLKVVGKVAAPLAVVSSGYDMVTAPNNTNRMEAAGDFVNSVAPYFGPVGESFSTGYTFGGLADAGIKKASTSTIGVDLSPSHAIALQLNMWDTVVSAVIPDDPNQPGYKNKNKISWFLIDKCNF
ncbi:hypothetical protein GCM10027167_22770 [Nocardia heshunensis]